MQTIESVTKEKWRALFIFILIDIIQILFVSMLTFDDSTLFVIGIDPARANPINSLILFISIGVFQFFYITYSIARMLSHSDMVKIYPEIPKEKIRCKYSPDDLVKWTLEIARRSGVKVDAIYLLKSPLPNAFTFQFPYFGTVVVIHSNVLDFLLPDEVKAIIAHEVGHVKNSDSMVSIFAQAPDFFIDIVYLYIYVRLGLSAANAILIQFDIGLGIVRILLLIGFFILSRSLMTLARIFINSSSKNAELLADYHAAKTISAIAMINALLRLGQRIEAITALIEEIRWLESQDEERITPVTDAELALFISQFPLDGIDATNARTAAPYLFLTTRLKNMREIYGIALDDKQIDAAVQPAAVSLLKKRRTSKAKSPLRPDVVVNWRKADSNSDRRISNDELVNLIEILRKNPQKMMFQNEVGMNIFAVDHPDFGRRILFLADVLGLGTNG